MKKVLGIILGGGAGTRLLPLTLGRAKPAVPIAGKYRLVDIPVSNCLNSEINQIFVLTQYNSFSLNQHINRAFHFGSCGGGFVEVLAAQMTADNQYWFRGTADAVRQFAELIASYDVDDVLILSGDQIYRMDFREVLEQHRRLVSDVTVVVVPVNQQDGSRFGLLKVDETSRQILEFREKPKGPALEEMRVNTARLGLSEQAALEKPFLGSAGIYAFKKDVLLELLSSYPESHDFGKHIIPAAVNSLRTSAYLFDGYWEDVGTVKSFYEENLALVTHAHPRFSFYDTKAPVHTTSRLLPPSKISNCLVEKALICDGSIIKGSRIEESIIGIRSRISYNCDVKRSIIMGADSNETTEERTKVVARGGIPLGIGEESVIHDAIIDKNVRIGSGVSITNSANLYEADRSDLGFMVREGIVVVIRGAVIKSGTRI